MKITPIHSRFGVEVQNINLRDVTATHLYPDIRDLFETHSLLLFRDQHLDDEEHLRFARLFGPIENRDDVKMETEARELAPVSNVTDEGSVYSDADWRLLQLKSNFLWHTDSTFLPIPALTNVLQARVVPNEGGATEFASTRAGFADQTPAMQERLRNMYFWHRYSHSRSRINPELARRDLFTMWEDQKWRAVWTNPANGKESIYVASHVYKVDGMDETESQAFVDDLIDGMTGPDAVYSHQWQPGDLLLWDERALLHRGTPWPYEQARTLVSTCTSAREVDGLASVRPDQG